ncbi:MAG: TrkH family potassium uptake protein, partial [Thermodesulfobacteriota bacterium]
MNIKFSFHVIGHFLKYLGLIMLAPSICSIVYREDDLWVLIAAALITSLFGFTLELLTKKRDTEYEIQRKDGFLIASLCWVTAAHFGALPYLFYGVFTNPIDAVFESIAGFTTTGATVLSEIEVLPHGILFWRSLTQWLGGMGIIVLGIAILPRLAVGGMQLMALETPGPTKEKMTPRIVETAKKLWGIYLIFTVVLIGLLIALGMPIYDSIMHSFTTISTGGFSTKNLSIAVYSNPLIEVVIIVFMFIAGVNFGLHYGFFRGDVKSFYNNSEFRFYLLLAIFAVLIVSLELWLKNHHSFIQALRYSSFQVVSISTTTGYTTTNFDIWPPLSKSLLLILMFLGGCAGSTAGAIKSIRIVVLFKKVFREMYKLIYPKVVMPIRLEKSAITDDVVSGITSFVLLYLLIFIIGSLLILGVENIDIMTAISAVAATIGNVGPGFGQVGPLENYGDFSYFTKIILSLLMLVGRLELFTILVLFTPA